MRCACSAQPRVTSPPTAARAPSGAPGWRAPPTLLSSRAYGVDHVRARRGAGVITLVLGGARSGKSELGERLIAAISPRVTYGATSVASDAEIAARIDAHRARRPADWTTVEADEDLATAVGGLTGAVLIDSLGGWVARAAGFGVDVDAL